MIADRFRDGVVRNRGPAAAGRPWGVSIAARFETALDSASERGLEGPELLPVRLARASAEILAVDAASLSFVDSRGERVPLGASRDDAETAERLQFTVGDGPCMAAQETRQPVFAVEEDLHRRWPAFADLLFVETPFRGVVALPLHPALSGPGAIDLYFEDPDAVTRLDVFEAIAVGELVTSELSDAAVWSAWTPEEGPEWLHGPAPQRRAAVWEAMGWVCVDLEVGAAEALDLMRAAAYAAGRTVDDVAEDLLAGRLRPHDLTDR
jgi:hypothetical protein